MTLQPFAGSKARAPFHLLYTFICFASSFPYHNYKRFCLMFQWYDFISYFAAGFSTTCLPHTTKLTGRRSKWYLRWPTTVTAKSFYSRQNQFRHGKINFITAKSTSPRQNQFHHGKINFATAKSISSR